MTIIVAAVPRETSERLEALAALIVAETERQNLISRTTIADMKRRHIEDSLQLLALAPTHGAWLDVGSGAGLPGLVIASATTRPVILVEPRRLRSAFLMRAAEVLGLTDRVTVLPSPVERVALPPVRVISARAVAPLDRLFAMAAHLSDDETTWLLMKGAHAADELAEALRTWQGAFRLVPSITEPAAAIVVATSVRRRD